MDGGKKNNTNIGARRAGSGSSGGARAFAAQLAVCLALAGAAAVLRQASPEAYVSVSASVDGLYRNNVTLADLGEFIGDKLLDNDAVSVFFNASGASRD